MLSVVGILLLVVSLVVVPGYGVLVNVNRLTPAERVGFAACASAVLCGAVALACFLTGANEWLAVLLPLAIGMVGLLIAMRRGCDFSIDDAAGQVALFWFLLTCEFVAVEAALPSFAGAAWFADWWVHFHRALVYANLVRVDDVARTCADIHAHCVAPVFDNGVLSTRPPLFNLVGAIAVGIDGGRLAAYQIAAAVWSTAVLGPAILLAQRRGHKSGALAGSLLLLNPFLLHLAVYPWSKMLTGAFAVASVYWLCRMRDSGSPARLTYSWCAAAASFSMVMAVYTHTGAILTLLAGIAFMLLRRRTTLAQGRGFILGAASGGALALPWVIWAAHYYGFRTAFLTTPGAPGAAHTLVAWLGNKVSGIASSIMPMPLINSLEHGSFTDGATVWTAVIRAQQFFFTTVTGALGVVVCALLIVRRRQVKLSDEAKLLAVLFAGASFLGSILLDPAPPTVGNASDAMQGAIVLGIVLFAGLPTVQQHAFVVLTAVALEAAIAYGLYFGYLMFGPWRSDANTMVLADMHQRMLSDDLGGQSAVITLASILLLLCVAAVCRRPPFRLPRGADDRRLSPRDSVLPEPSTGPLPVNPGYLREGTQGGAAPASGVPRSGGV